MMGKEIKRGRKAEFTVSEPPFNYDPRSEGAMEKLARANKIGLGKVIDEKQSSTAESANQILNESRSKKTASRAIRKKKAAHKKHLTSRTSSRRQSH